MWRRIRLSCRRKPCQIDLTIVHFSHNVATFFYHNDKQGEAEMKMKNFVAHRHFVGLLVVALWSLGANCWSEDFFLEGYETYGLGTEDFGQMQIVPPSMMDTDTLFMAAQEQRETSMSMSQRLLNNRWLLSQGKADHSGAEGLRKYLRLYFLRNWKSQDTSSDSNSNSYLPLVKIEEPSQFQDLSNYHLRVSDDKVNLKFKYNFD